MGELYLKKRRNQPKVPGKVNVLAHTIIWRYRVALAVKTFYCKFKYTEMFSQGF